MDDRIRPYKVADYVLGQASDESLGQDERDTAIARAHVLALIAIAKELARANDAAGHPYPDA